MAKNKKIKNKAKDTEAPSTTPSEAVPQCTLREGIAQVSITPEFTKAAAFIFILTIIVYLPVLGYGSVTWDDSEFLENPLVLDFTWINLKELLTTFYYKAFSQPITIISFSIERMIFGASPFVNHLTNVILHATNSVLVFYLIYMLYQRMPATSTPNAALPHALLTAGVPTAGVLAAGVGGVLFAVHPLHVESVAWISERKDVLSTLFFLLSIICYLRYSEGRRYFYGLSLAAYVLALLAKLMVITLPVVLLLLDYLRGRRLDKKLILEKIPFFALSVIFGLIGMLIHSSNAKAEPFLHLAIIAKVLVFCYNLFFYIAKTILPIKLTLIYPYPEIIGNVYLIYPLLLAVLIALVVYSRRHTRVVIFGTLFFIITIFPTLKMVGFPSGGSLLNERYMYIPSIGLFFMAGLGFNHLYTNYSSLVKKATIGAAVLIVLIFSILSWQRVHVWENSETLWKDTILKSPTATIPYGNLAVYLAKEKRFDEAIENYKKINTLEPKNTIPYFGLADIYAELKQYNMAMGYYEKGFSLDPEEFAEMKKFGSLYMAMDELDKAIEMFEAAIKLDPEIDIDTHFNLALAYADSGRLREAALEAKKILAIDPEDKDAGSLLDDLNKALGK
jgi:tetratricopeptide (TPR) repeat protein